MKAMSHRQMIKVSTSTLVQIAAGTFITGSTALYLVQNHMQSKVRTLPHYTETFEIVARHDKLMSTLGRPIQIGKVDLADRRRNYVDETVSELRIPVSGPLSSGYLNVKAARKSAEDKFHTVELAFECPDGEFVVFRTD